MKKQMFAILMSIVSSATVTLASDGGHNGDEASTVSCRVLDASGKELKSTVKSKTDQGVLTIRGFGKGFTYGVTFAEATAILSLTNKVSGDKITVHEGDFDIGEVVKATLETDEEPGQALTLECAAN